MLFCWCISGKDRRWRGKLLLVPSEQYSRLHPKIYVGFGFLHLVWVLKSVICQIYEHAKSLKGIYSKVTVSDSYLQLYFCKACCILKHNWSVKCVTVLFISGMWAHSMTVQDYQDLIDRGWRR